MNMLTQQHKSPKEILAGDGGDPVFVTVIWMIPCVAFWVGLAGIERVIGRALDSILGLVGVEGLICKWSVSDIGF